MWKVLLLTDVNCSDDIEFSQDCRLSIGFLFDFFLVVTVSLEASQVDVTEDSDNVVVLVRAAGAREREIRVK